MTVCRRTAPVVVVFLCLCGGLLGGAAAEEGPAASNASDPTAERTLNETAAEPGETVRVTATISRDSAGPVDYLDEFEPAFAEAVSLVSLTANGDPISESLLGEFNDTLVVSVESAPAGTVTVVYDVTVPVSATPGESYSFDGLAQTGDGDEDQTSVGGESTLVVDGPPTFEVALSSVPGSVTVGKSLTVEATVTNTGDGGGTQQIGFSVDGQNEGSTALTLDTGESESVTFGYTATEADTPAVDIAVSSANETATETVAVETAASFEVGLPSVPGSVTVGENLTVEATVTNTGDIEGTQQILLTVDDQEEGSKAVTLGPDGTGSVVFGYTVTAADTPAVDIAVSSANETVTRTVAVTERAVFAVELSALPGSVPAGTALSGSATVTNVGGTVGTQSVTVTAGGEQVTGAQVTLGPDETESVEFGYTTTEKDTPELTVAVSSANETATESVAVAVPASFAVALSSVPAATTVGEEVIVEATVTNTGDMEGTQQIGFAVDGRDEADVNLTLGPDETESVEFGYTTTETDTPEVTVTVSSANETATGAVGVTEQAFFDISLIDVPTSVAAGGTLRVEATVTNVGGESGTQSVSFAVDGGTQESTAVTLDRNESVSVEFEHIPGVAGSELNLTVSSANETVTETVGVEMPALFEISLGPVPGSVAAGGPLTVPVTVTNTGDETGTQQVTLAVNGEPVADTDITLDGGADETVTLGYTVGETDETELGLTVSSANETATDSVTVVESVPVEVSLGSVPGSVSPGDVLTVPVVITNVGEVGGIQSVTFAVDGTPVETAERSLAPGETETVTFGYAVERTDGPELTVEASSADATASETVRVAGQAVFAVTAVSVPDPVSAGERTTVTATVTNLGSEGTQSVDVVVEGETVTGRNLTLAGNASEEVTFGYTVAETDSPVLAVTVASNNDTVTATTTVLSPPAFEVTALSVPAAAVGDLLTVTATVTNTGDIAATQQVSLGVDGTTRESKQVELAGGASETVRFRHTPGESGNRELTVASENSTATETVRVTPQFEMTLVSITESVVTGEIITAIYSVENTGTISATQTVRFGVAGDPMVNRTLTLEGGEQTTLRFNHTPTVDGPSTVELSAGTDTDTVSTRVSVAEQTHQNTSSSDDGSRADDGETGNRSDDMTGPGLGSGAVVFGLLGLALLASRYPNQR